MTTVWSVDVGACVYLTADRGGFCGRVLSWVLINVGHELAPYVHKILNGSFTFIPFNSIQFNSKGRPV
jgi:hypothetical protein